MSAAHNGKLFSDVVNDVVGNSRSIIPCAFSVFACIRSVVGVAARLRYGDTGHVGLLPASARLDESRTGSETRRDSRSLAIEVLFPLEISDDAGGRER